jgi:hypothetical protein
VTIRRLGLLAEQDGAIAKQYANALNKISHHQAQSGPIVRRMLSARQVASLLKWYRDVEDQQATMPRSLRAVVRKGTLLGMMSASLADPSAVVRAEMLAGLEQSKLDGDVLNRLGLVMGDASGLVRFRVVSLLGQSDNKGNAKMLEIFAKDKNKFVRLLARAFLRAKKRATK